MIYPSALIGYCINSMALGFMVTGLFITIFDRDLRRRTHAFFMDFFWVGLFYVATNLTAGISLEEDISDILSRMMMFLQYMFASVLMLLLTSYIVYCWGKSTTSSPLYAIVCVIWVVFLMMLVSTWFTDWIYTVTTENVFQKGPFYFTMAIPPTIIMVLDLIAVLINHKKLTKRQRQSFLVFFVLPIFAIAAQVLYQGSFYIVIAIAAGAVIMLLITIKDQAETRQKQQEEIEKHKFNVAVLQMRPHFIYNTMMSIYYLCEQDPQKAQQITLDFTNYLRKNFTAIVKEDPVEFAEELEHAKNYLAVELVRFEGKLSVEYDTPHTDFLIPPLTLQPLVENCVKHGVTSEQKPLHVVVRTRKTDKGSEVIVEDDGPGIKKEENNHPHVALANIRGRLLLMCNGSIEISPRSEGGTIVTIFIPDKKDGGGQRVSSEKA